jgi:hypothetical protein
MNESPQFRAVLRGYDPDQVTAVVTDLTSSLMVARRTAADRTMELTRAQQRADSLEAQLSETTEKLSTAQQDSTAAPDAFAIVGTRLTAILELAEEEAGQVRADGQRFADEVRAAAETEAERITQEAADKAAEAERAAATLTQTARREARRTSQQAHRVTAQSERARDEAVAQLHGVLDLLADLENELAEDALMPDGAPTR